MDRGTERTGTIYKPTPAPILSSSVVGPRHHLGIRFFFVSLVDEDGEEKGAGGGVNIVWTVRVCGEEEGRVEGMKKRERGERERTIEKG